MLKENLKQFFGPSLKSAIAKIIFGIFLFVLVSYIYSIIFESHTNSFGSLTFGWPFQFFTRNEICALGDSCNTFNIFGFIADIILWYFASCLSTLVFNAKSLIKILKIIFCGLIIVGVVVIIILLQVCWGMFGFVGEGQYVNSYQRCLPGLVMTVQNSRPIGGICTPTHPIYYICTKCGDGICEGAEDKCNCPKDCKDSSSLDQTAGPALSGVEGWKTYTNTQYGFEIKYPPYWHSVNLSSIHQDNVFAFCVEDSNDCNVNAVKIQIYTPNSATDLLNEWRKQGSKYKEKNITIGGTYAVEREESYCQVKPLITNGIFIEKNSYSLQIQGPISTCGFYNDKIQIDYPNASITFNQMLSTFKFTK
jgi:hypothetical protein